MPDKKLWSPGKERKVWIVWYEDEDRYDASVKRVYAHKIEAEDDVRETLRLTVEGQLEGLSEGDPDELDRPRELLLQILKEMGKDVGAALSDWESYAEDFGVPEKIFFEEATLYGA